MFPHWTALFAAVSSILISTSVMAQPCPYSEPAADYCTAARVIPGTVGHHVVLTDVSSATGVQSACHATAGKTVWFKVVPQVSGPMTVSTCHPGTSYDTVVQVYSGGDNQCEGMLAEDCEDDTPLPECANGCSGSGSVVTFNAIAGVTYRIEVGAYGDNSGGCALCLGLIVTIGTPCGEEPLNVACSEARELPGTPGTHEVLVDAAGAVLPVTPSPSCVSNAGHATWFHMTPTVDGLLTFSTCHPNTDYDTVVQAFRGDCAGLLQYAGCNDDTADPACTNACGYNRGSTVSIEATAGTDYYFAVGSYNWNSAGCELCLGVRATLSTCVSDADCDDGNPCTEDRCAEGSCTNTEVPYGVACPSDGVECTDDVCSGTGECIHPYKPAGTRCGDPSRTSCTDPDSCDGQGTCLPRHVPAGQPCESDGNVCTRDECNGAGVCTHPSQADGTTCTDDGIECTRDVCSAGVCAHPLKPGGSPCGSSTDTACDRPDTCNGIVCQPNYVAAGSPCPPDSDECTDDLCDGAGSCEHHPIPGCCPADLECCEDAHCDDGRFCTGVETCAQNRCVRGSSPCGDGEICNDPAGRCDTDCNRNGVPDIQEPGASGLLLTRTFPAVADAYVDSATPDTNFGGGFDVAGTFLEIGAHSVLGQTEAWMAFNLSSIPPGARIHQAQLQATARPGGFGADTVVTARAALGAWEEGGLTWSTRPAAGTAIADQVFTSGAASLTWDVTPLVHTWVTGSAANHGVVLRSAPSVPDWTRFLASRETGSPPTLNITYGLPICSSAFTGLVQLAGFGPPEQNPIRGARIELYGSDVPHELGNLLYATASDAAGVFTLYHAQFAERPYRQYTLVGADPNYIVVAAIPGREGFVTPESHIRFLDVIPEVHPVNVFQLAPRFVPQLVRRTFIGRTILSGTSQPAPRVEVILYGADQPSESRRVLAGVSSDEDGAFRLSIETKPEDTYPYYVIHVADFEFQVTAARSGGGSPDAEHRVVFRAPPPGEYAGNEFDVNPLATKTAAVPDEDATLAGGGTEFRPVVVVLLTPQCTCTDNANNACTDPPWCDANRCRNITNPNVLTSFGQTLFATTGDSMRNFFLEMSHNRFSIRQAGLLQTVPPDLTATPTHNESTLCDGLGGSEKHRAYVAQSVLGQQLQFNFASFDADQDGTVEENELIVLLAATDSDPGNARTRTSDPATVTVGNVGVRVNYIMVQPGTDFYTIAHELAHSLTFTLRSGSPGDQYGGAGNTGAYSLMDNHCQGRGGNRDPNTPWNAVQLINNARLPHLDPWNKIQLGWITPMLVTADISTAIQSIYSAGGQVLKLQTVAHGDKEYFLVENRWAAGSTYDTDLLDSGLAIWHVNENYLPDQSRAVALERAGGGANSGAATAFCNDDNDNTALWSGEENFHRNSSPNSDWVSGSASGVAVLCIGPPGPGVNAYLSRSWAQNLLTEDTAEPNDTLAAATTLALPVNRNLSLHAPCDKDFFRIMNTDYVDLTVVTNGFADAGHQQPAAAPTVILRDGIAQVLQSAQGSLAHPDLQPGTYYLEVSSNGLIYYRLQIAAAPITIAPDRFDDQTPPGEPRNDTIDHAAIILDELQANNLLAMGSIDDLNHDIIDDVDFFTIQLDREYGSFGEPECCSTVGPETTQGMFRLSIAPDTIRPFTIVMRRPDGTMIGTSSGLTFTLPCPHQFVPDGKLTFSIHDDAGRNFYDVSLGYNRCDTRFYPDWFLEFDPPAFRRTVPEFPNDLRSLFPMDPIIQEAYFRGEVSEPLPAEYLVFDLTAPSPGDYRLNMVLPRGGSLDLALLNEAGNVVAVAVEGGSFASADETGTSEVTKLLQAPDLPPGTYFLRVSGGAFGTSYTLDADLEGDLNSDSAVDLRDVAALQRCFGQGGTQLQSECAEGDLSGDGSIGLDDLSILTGAMTGPR